MRIPVDKNGDLLYDINTCQEMLKTYRKVFPDRAVIAMPNNIKIWEDVDLESLKHFRDYLITIIQDKEEELAKEVED